MGPTFSIKTLGCKLNQYESALMAQRLIAGGWEARPFGEAVDLVIVNTCTVTDRSDKKCRNYIRQGARLSAAGKSLVTGCLVQRDPEGLAAMPEVGVMLSNDEKDLLENRIEALLGPLPRDMAAVADPPVRDELPVAPLFRTRGYVKIQDGCDGGCSYCIVPSVRGAPHSRGFNEILSHVRSLVERGCPELVLTGITIGKYSREGRGLADLVEAIAQLEGDFRLRITSIEPRHLDERLIALLGKERICPHIHLPLQSGSDSVLKAMNRPYTIEYYLELLGRLRAHDPRIAVGTDIIIGFPGESDADFEQSLEMVARAGFSYVHQFSFSPRSGTPASGMDGACSAAVIMERSARMREAASSVGLEYRKQFVNEVLPCVIEKHGARGGYTAVSGNYIKMELQSDPRNRDVAGRIAGVRMIHAGREGNLGVLA